MGSRTTSGEPVMPKSPLYDTDFYAWTEEQAALLREGRLSSADVEHIAEEIESMGRTEKRELISRLAVLMMHLLKLEFQPGRRGSSWRATVRLQRRELRRHLEDNPSLRAKLTELAEDAYTDARLRASAETGMDEASFPWGMPWSVEQALSDDFWPGDNNC